MIDNAEKAKHLLNIIADAAEEPDKYELVGIEATRNKDGVTVYLLAIVQIVNGVEHVLPLAEFCDFNDYKPAGERITH